VSTDPKDGPADRSREDVRFDTCRPNSEKGGVRVKGLRNCAARQACARGGMPRGMLMSESEINDLTTLSAERRLQKTRSIGPKAAEKNVVRHPGQGVE